MSSYGENGWFYTDTGSILVHADGGDCHGTPLVHHQCPVCGIHPDMQSTEFWKPSHIKPLPDVREPLADSPSDRFPVSTDEDGLWWIKGKIHHVWIQKRPAYCDRGHYIAHVEPAPGSGHEYSIDDSDKWPRYYMDAERMVGEIRDWLDWREGDGPKKAGEATFG